MFLRRSAIALGLLAFLLFPTSLQAMGGRETASTGTVSTGTVSTGTVSTGTVSTGTVVTDLRGRQVRVPERVEKLLALGAGSLRLVAYLDAVDSLVAVEDQGHGREKTANEFFNLATYRLAHPGLRQLPSIGGAENHEAIIAAAPDLIISSTVDPSQLDHLQAVLGIPVFAIDADVEIDEAERFFLQLRSLGMVLDREARAEELISGITETLNDLDQRAARVSQPRRAYAGGMMFYGPADLLRTTGDYLPFRLTATMNVMPSNPSGNRQPYMTSIEDLLVAIPEYAFIDAANLSLSRSGLLANRQVLTDRVPAFGEGRIYTNLVYKYYGTNWENQLINVYFVGMVLYPELYADLSFPEKAEAIWRLFFGRDLDYSYVVAAQGREPGRLDWLD